MKILFIGHNTFKFTLASGKVLLSDPWFKNSFIWRATPPAFGPGEIGRIDFMLASHNHLDHIDGPSLELAREQGSVVVGSKRVAERARKAGVEDVVALVPGEEKNFDGFSVKATPAFHPLAKDAIGFLIKTGGRIIYFSGDTRLDPRLTEFLQKNLPIELAFLQISCARYFGKDDGLNVFTAAELASAIKAQIVVPMHLHARFKHNQGGVEKFKQLLSGSGIQPLVFGLGEEKAIE